MSILQKTSDTCHITILVLPESSMMCVASVLDPLRAANRVGNSRLYSWGLTSLSGGPVDLTCGIELDVQKPFNERFEGDLLVIVGGFNHYRHVTSGNLQAIRKAASGFRAVAGVEAGSWVLARAGLLDGFAATTHWEDYEPFAAAFPEVEVKPDRYVIDRNRLTCGGASPALDMFLDLIRERNGPVVAMEVASVFIYEPVRARSDMQPLVSLGSVGQKEPRVEFAVRLMEKSIEQPLSISSLGQRIGVSSKTLEALFKRHTGMTPGRFYLNLRLKSASRMVLDTNLSMREIAVRSGFNSLAAFSRAYRQNFGVSASTVRLGGD